MIVNTTTALQWAFDKDGKLIEIFVDRTQSLAPTRARKIDPGLCLEADRGVSPRNSGIGKGSMVSVCLQQEVP